MKNVVQEPRCSWSKRLRLYNQFVQGNAELLSISSTDSIWNSEDEDDDDDREEFEVRIPKQEKLINVVDEEEEDSSKDLWMMDNYKKSILQRYLADSIEQKKPDSGSRKRQHPPDDILVKEPKKPRTNDDETALIQSLQSPVPIPKQGPIRPTPSLPFHPFGLSSTTTAFVSPLVTLLQRHQGKITTWHSLHIYYSPGIVDSVVTTILMLILYA